MKIIDSKHYLYSNFDKTAWERSLFHPISDHKFTMITNDGLLIECASFELIEKGQSEIHACLSSQAGCKYGCIFCTSGMHGFQRNLTSEEITGQLYLMAKYFRVNKFNHVVYMGIGEPLDNLEAVAESIKKINSEDNWYSGKLTVCTVGPINKFDKLLKLDIPWRFLWLSLHAATDEKRRLIMPIAKSNTIEHLINKVDNFMTKSNIPTCINYMILHGFNDLDEDVTALTKLLKQSNRKLVVMLTIPNGKINGFCPGNSQDTENFKQKLIDAGVKNKIVRFLAAGRTVNAGCGELLFLPQKPPNISN